MSKHSNVDNAASYYERLYAQPINPQPPVRQPESTGDTTRVDVSPEQADHIERLHKRLGIPPCDCEPCYARQRVRERARWERKARYYKYYWGITEELAPPTADPPKGGQSQV